jgi:MoaA/NifB/PqqE/SkfB family radical SAM enzyme
MKALIDHYGYVPETCVWEITRACNLRCGHCGTAAGRPRPHELSTAQAVDVARQLARLGNRLTTLSGGEPTLREDWPEIARALVDAGVTVNMVTNGQSDGTALAVRAKQAGLANVAVSLDGLADTHDALRGHGAFARAVDAIGNLTAAKIWVDVMFTVNRKNQLELPDVWELAGRLGAKTVRVQLGKPMGNQTHREDLTLQAQDLLSLLPLLGRLAARHGPDVRIGDSVGYFSPEERVLRGRFCDQGHWTGCYAGVRAIGIQADGSVKGCLSLQPRAGEADRFVEGSLRTESLESIWFRPDAFAYNRHFELGNLRGACAKCSHAALCRGGATCVAYAYSGEVGCDPMCYYQMAGLSEATRLRVWPLSAPAAAAALMISLGGCGGEESGNGSGSGGNAAVGGAGGATPTHTGGVSAQLDYGVAAPQGGKTAATISSSSGGLSVQPDYGVLLPTGGAQGQSGGAQGQSGGAGGTVSHTGQGGGSSLGKGGGAATGGTNHSAGAMSKGGSANGGTSSKAGASGTTAVDCSSVCCECDYGIYPAESYQACCLQGTGGASAAGGTSHGAGGNTSTAGTSPSAGGGAANGGTTNMAGAAGKAAINCSGVCCLCDYGVIAPEILDACCQ